MKSLLQKKSYLPIKNSILCLFVAVTCCFSTSCNKSNSFTNQQLNEYDTQVWKHPDSILCFLEQISPDSLTKSDKIHWKLLREMASMKCGIINNNDSILKEIITYYREQKDYGHLCTALYTIAGQNILASKHTESILYLKEAADYTKYAIPQNEYRGMISYTLGIAYERDMLFALALECYREALPAFMEIQDYGRVACLYRDIARMHCELNDSSYISDFELAQQYALQANDSAIYIDTRCQEELSRARIDTITLISYSNQFAQLTNNQNYMLVPAHYYVDHNILDSASYYLYLFSEDTIYTQWNWEQYHYLHSWLQHKQGLYEDAYYELKGVYDEQCEQIQRDAKARTYAIARRYDVEKEQERNMQLTIQRQRLIITLGGIVVVSIIFGLIAVWLITRERQRRRLQEQAVEIERLRAEKAELKQKKAEEAKRTALIRNNQLQSDIEDKRRTLLHIVRQRIDITRALQQSATELPDETPAWLKDFLNTYSLAGEKNWKKFNKEFSSLYGTSIKYISETYPDLTQQDLQYISLLLLGLETRDISYLLGTTERTIWNRRQKIKNRIREPHLDIDEWLTKMREL